MTMQFDGTNYLQSKTDLTPFEPGTICFWMKPSAVGGANIRIVGSDDAFEVILEPSGGNSKVRCDIYDDLGPTAATIIVVDTLYHVTVTWDVTGGNVDCEIFINGVSDGSSTQATTTPSTAKFRIGSRTGSTQHFSGILDDVRLYDRILADDEIQTIFASRGVDGITLGLKTRMLMNESV